MALAEEEGQSQEMTCLQDNCVELNSSIWKIVLLHEHGILCTSTLSAAGHAAQLPACRSCLPLMSCSRSHICTAAATNYTEHPQHCSNASKVQCAQAHAGEVKRSSLRLNEQTVCEMRHRFQSIMRHVQLISATTHVHSQHKLYKSSLFSSKI